MSNEKGMKGREKREKERMDESNVSKVRWDVGNI